MKLEALGKVDRNGIMRIHNRHIFDSMLLNHFKDKDVEVVVKTAKKNRSNNQNRYYWGVVIPIVQQGIFDTQGDWMTAEQTHQFLKTNFNYSEKVNEKTGEVLRFTNLTSYLSTIDFEIYMDKIRAFSDEYFGVIIPMPNEQTTINL